MNLWRENSLNFNYRFHFLKCEWNYVLDHTTLEHGDISNTPPHIQT